MSAEHGHGGHGGHGTEPLWPESEHTETMMETARVLVHAGFFAPMTAVLDALFPGTAAPGGGHGGGHGDGHH